MRIVDDGFEIQDSLAYVDITGTLAWSTTIKAGNGDGGARSIRLANDTFGHAFTAVDEVYLRVRIYIDDWNSNFKFLTWRSGATELGSLRADAGTGQIKGYTGTGTLVLTHPTVLTTEKWYLVRARIKIADASGVLEADLDLGAPTTFTGDTKPGSDTTFDRILHISGSSDDYNLDDFAVNSIVDTDGLGDTGYPPNAYCIILSPTGAGDNTGLTPSAGANWQNVDDNPPSAADYNESAAAAHDLYALENRTLLSGQTVLAHKPIARGWGVGAGAGASVQVGIKGGGTEAWSGNIALPSSMGVLAGVRSKSNPGGGAMDQTFLDGAQVGFKVI